jgi:hypothetical protein
MNVQHIPDHNKLCGSVAGYRVRNGLRRGLVARIGGEAFAVLSEELLGHSPSGLARYGKSFPARKGSKQYRQFKSPRPKGAPEDWRRRMKSKQLATVRPLSAT